MTTTFAPGSLEADCPGGLPWAWYGLDECIRTTRDQISIAFGVLSIAAWFFFGAPQVVTNCVKKMPHVALSPYLLGFWLVGDTLNMVGAYMTYQLFLQKVLAGFTVLMDLIMIGQYLFYLCKEKRNIKKYAEESDCETENVVVISTDRNSKTLATAILGVVCMTTLFGPSLVAPMHTTNNFFGSRTLLQANGNTEDPFKGFLETDSEKIGYAIGWIGAVMYFCSRVPQIVTNFKRKSTEGLSMFMFLLAVLGNTFYGLQIFIKSIDAVFVVKSLPWILGSLGILVFDVILLVQFFIYRHNTVDTKMDDLNSKEETV